MTQGDGASWDGRTGALVWIGWVRYKLSFFFFHPEGWVGTTQGA